MSILFFKQGKIVLVTKVWKMEFAQNSYVSIMNLAVVKEIVLLTTRHVYVMKASVALTVQLISKVKNYALIWNYILGGCAHKRINKIDPGLQYHMVVTWVVFHLWIIWNYLYFQLIVNHGTSLVKTGTVAKSVQLEQNLKCDTVNLRKISILI